jgi:hypothetical protein
MNTDKPTPTKNDFFTELYDVNDHTVQKPRVISGGGKITREQAAALGIVVPTREPDSGESH